MKNKAKCKLCQSIIESFHAYDYVTCKCGEISVDGGTDAFRCMAKNFDNFLRVDDEGNEIVVKVVEKETQKEASDAENTNQPLGKPEMLDMLESMTKNIEALPESAMTLPINHYDFYSFMMVITSILKGCIK